MLVKTQTIQYAELQTLTPELGLFVITGTSQDVAEATKSFNYCKNVSKSTFDRAAYGRPPKKLLWF